MKQIFCRQFVTLTLNTLQREARSRTLLTMGVITFLIIILTNMSFNFIAEFAKSSAFALDVGDKKMVVLARILNFWASFMGFYFGICAIKSDEENGVQPLLLSFPISRAFYLLSRFFGVVLIVMIYHLVSLLFAYILFSFSSGVVDISAKMIYSILGTLLVISGSALLGLLGSLYFSRTISLVLSIIFLPMIVISNTVFSGQTWGELFKDITIYKSLWVLLYIFVPRIGVWSDITSRLIEGAQIPHALWPEIAHFFVSSTFIIGLIILIFKRRGV